MKKISLFIILLSMITLSIAQKIVVKDQDYEIEKINRTGLAVVIELDKKFVQDLWKDKLKDLGKVNSSKGEFIIDVAQLPEVSSSPVKIYSVVEKVSHGTMVWLAIDMGSSLVTPGQKGYKSAVKVLEDFAKSCFIADINEQIKDAEKAKEDAIKDQEKMIKEGDKLSNELSDNAKEKEKLEQELVENGNEKVTIEKNIEQNKKDKVAAKDNVKEMEKAVEVVKAKLEKFQ